MGILSTTTRKFSLIHNHLLASHWSAYVSINNRYIKKSQATQSYNAHETWPFI